jgi:hypothetical protein
MAQIPSVTGRNFWTLDYTSNYQFKALVVWLLAAASGGLQAQTTSQDQEVSQAIKAPNASYASAPTCLATRATSIPAIWSSFRPM